MGSPVAVAGVLRAMDAGRVVLVVVPVRACGGAGVGLGGCWRGAAVWCGRLPEIGRAHV